jgi:folate-binding protein YgfZ
VTGAEHSRPVLDGRGTVEAVRAASCAGPVTRAEVVAVRGRDAGSFLQGQLSQDLRPLEPGSSALSLVLEPRGQLVGVVRAHRLAGEDWAVEVVEGVGERVLERLRRFKVRVRADLELLAVARGAVYGPAAPEAEAAGTGGPATLDEVLEGKALLRAPLRLAGRAGEELLGTPELLARRLDDVPVGDAATLEALRIAAGWPAWGAELSERSLPHEAGLVGTTVSVTKGCYTGQELVARLEARGANVPRRLCGVVGRAGADLPVAPPRPGTEVQVDLGGRPAGALTSTAAHPLGDGWIGLAYVRRGVALPAPCRLAFPGAAGAEEGARLEPLPLELG